MLKGMLNENFTIQNSLQHSALSIQHCKNQDHPVIRKRISSRAVPASLWAATSIRYSPGANRASGRSNWVSLLARFLWHWREIEHEGADAIDELRGDLNGIAPRLERRHPQEQALGAAELAIRDGAALTSAMRSRNSRADWARKTCGGRITGFAPRTPGTSKSSRRRRASCHRPAVWSGRTGDGLAWSGRLRSRAARSSQSPTWPTQLPLRTARRLLAS